MTKTKTVTLALAVAGLTGCETVDPFNLFGQEYQEYYEFDVGSPPNTQPFSSYPQSDGTSVDVKVRMNF